MKALALLAGFAIGCAHPQCPAAYHANAARVAHLTALLQSDPEARPLLSATPALVCFAPGVESVSTNEALLLDQSQPDDALAARMAHLLLHRSRGQTRTSGNGPDEAEANALERRVLSRLTTPPPR